MKRTLAGRFVVFALIAGVTLAMDLSSKSLVFHDLGYPGADAPPYAAGAHRLFDAPRGTEGQSRAYLDGRIAFRLFTSFNPGALWGLGQRHTSLFTVLSLAAVLGIPAWLFAFRAARSLWLTVAAGFILGGTLGNLYDRLGLHGCCDDSGRAILAVRDFLLFTFGTFHWPVFNFADAFLVTGATMLVLHSFYPRPDARPAQAPDQGTTQAQRASASGQTVDSAGPGAVPAANRPDAT